MSENNFRTVSKTCVSIDCVGHYCFKSAIMIFVSWVFLSYLSTHLLKLFGNVMRIQCFFHQSMSVLCKKLEFCLTVYFTSASNNITSQLPIT